jgi:predicted permease
MNRLFVVVVLAFGIGAVTAMVSVADAVWFRALPFGDAERLQELNAVRGDKKSGVAAGDFAALRKAKGIAESTLFTRGAANLIGVEGAESAFVERLAGDGLQIYGIAPLMGVLPVAGAREVVLSHRLWKRRYGSADDVVGRMLTVDGEAWRIAAVMPEGLSVVNRTDLWMPWVFGERDLKAHGEASSVLVVRLASGVSAEAVEAEVEALARAWQPERYAPLRLRLRGLEERLVGNVGSTIWMLLGAVGAVLLVACLNAGSLLVAEGMAREREMVVRMALGAGPWDLVRMVLGECARLAMAAAMLGASLAWGLVETVRWGYRDALGMPLPRMEAMRVDGTALGVCLVVTLGCVLLAGAGPALLAVRAFGMRGLRFAWGATVLQCALTVVLLAGGGLLLRSWQNLMAVDAGFAREGVLTARVPAEFKPNKRFGDAKDEAHYAAVLEAVRGIPGVRAAALTTMLPLGRVSAAVDFRPEGKAAVKGWPEYVASYGVTPDYLRVMGIPLRAGRWFDERDRLGNEAVVVINEVAARTFWPGENPVGKRVAGNVPVTVIGVVGAVRRGSLQDAPEEEVYRPFGQFLFGLHGTTLVARGLDAERLREVMRERFPNQPVADVRVMAAWVEESVERPRLYARLVGGFALLALLIAGAGIYAAFAQMAAMRRREIGIRVAVGATAGDVLALVGRTGAWMLGVGMALGVLGSWAVGDALRVLLFGVEAGDWGVLGAACGVFAVVGMAAMAWPAWRASRVDPAGVLRGD